MSRLDDAQETELVLKRIEEKAGRSIYQSYLHLDLSNGEDVEIEV